MERESEDTMRSELILYLANVTGENEETLRALSAEELTSLATFYLDVEDAMDTIPPTQPSGTTTDQEAESSRLMTMPQEMFGEMETQMDTDTFVQFTRTNPAFRDWVRRNNIWQRRLDRLTDGQLQWTPGRNPYWELRAWELGKRPFVTPDLPSGRPSPVSQLSFARTTQGSVTGGVVTISLRPPRNVSGQFAMQRIVVINMSSELSRGPRARRNVRPPITDFVRRLKTVLDATKDDSSTVQVMSDHIVLKLSDEREAQDIVTAVIYFLISNGFRHVGTPPIMNVLAHLPNDLHIESRTKIALTKADMTSGGKDKKAEGNDVFAELEPKLDTSTFARFIEENGAFDQWVTQNNIWSRRINRITGGKVRMEPGRNPYYALRAWELASLLPKPDNSGRIPRMVNNTYRDAISYSLTKDDRPDGARLSVSILFSEDGKPLDVPTVLVFFPADVDVDSNAMYGPYDALIPVVRQLWSAYNPRESRLNRMFSFDKSYFFDIPDAQLTAAMRVLFYRLYMAGLRVDENRGVLHSPQVQLSAKLDGSTGIF